VSARGKDYRPLIAHIIFRFDVGGLENGLVNLVNGLPADEFRHVIVALSDATRFRDRISRADVTVCELHKRPGTDPSAYLRLYRLLRELRPDVVHTRNFGTLDCNLAALLAGVRCRIHGEHGWDIHDPDGTSRKHRRIRRAMNTIVQRFVTVSRDLESWLVDSVGIPPRKVRRICNGVDTDRFRPSVAPSRQDLPEGRFPPGSIIVGSVTRFEEIKDPLNLVRSFIEARRSLQPAGLDVRLLMVGDGPLREQAVSLINSMGHGDAAWLPGSRADVAQLLTTMQLYVLGSRREGISNTVLEAMASGLPVIASATGGNLELVVPGVTGRLVPPGDSMALAAAIVDYASDADMRARHGLAARARVVQEFSISRMIREYQDLYRVACARPGVAA
jgi:sugar transferase (PEP-CTERM/EpsH1 system associated)